MKNVMWFLFFVICSSFELSAQNCENYKNGKFRLVDENSGTTYIIERKNNIQTEQKEGEDFKIDFVVKWLSSCSYSLTPTPKSAEFLKSEMVLIVDIKEVKDNFLLLEMYTKEYPNQKMQSVVEIM